MSWTPATSIGPRPAHPGRASRVDRPVPISLEKSWLSSQIHSAFLLPLDSSKSLLQHLRAPFACRTWRCESPFPQAEMGTFCTILVQCKSFRCNTSGPPRMCCKQRTCAMSKSRRCNTYKNTGGGRCRHSYPHLRSSLVTHYSPFPRRGPFRRKLDHAVS
jgi:hypothetical protein